MIAKSTINPCYGIACKFGSNDMMMNMGWNGENKIFPEEIENANSYAKEAASGLSATNYFK
jgi:hypothetical protein